jgi:hypothetical protein
MARLARSDTQVSIPVDEALGRRIAEALRDGNFVLLTSDGKPLAEVRPVRPLLGTVRYPSDEALMSSEWRDE